MCLVVFHQNSNNFITSIEKVGTACTTSGNECTATLETCGTSPAVCECASTYVNPGDGTCVLKGILTYMFLLQNHFPLSCTSISKYVH